MSGQNDSDIDMMSVGEKMCVFRAGGIQSRRTPVRPSCLQIMFYSEGFRDARTLARKMQQLYRLSSEQLSKQDHYDFGMRAVKSILVMAGSLKRAEPNLPEDMLLIRAMRDSNIPKFLKDDAILFMALVTDLFPGIEIVDAVNPVLRWRPTVLCSSSPMPPPPRPSFVCFVCFLIRSHPPVPLLLPISPGILEARRDALDWWHCARHGTAQSGMREPCVPSCPAAAPGPPPLRRS